MEQYTPPKELRVEPELLHDDKYHVAGRSATLLADNVEIARMVRGKVKGDGRDPYTESLAAELARRYNCHEELVGALREFVNRYEIGMNVGHVTGSDIDRLRAALDLAEKK